MFFNKTLNFFKASNNALFTSRALYFIFWSRINA